MPIYTVQGPDGKTYTVEGPAGATAEQVGQFVMSQQQSAPAGQPAQTIGQVPNEGPSGIDRFARGLRDPIDGGAQLLTKLLPDALVQAGNRANNWLADSTGLVGRLPEGGVDQQVREREAEYQAARGKDAGVDWLRIAGNVASPANVAIGAGLPNAATTGGRVLAGAIGGSASAAMNPVTQGDDFVREKLSQLAIGAGSGAAVPALIGGIGRVISPNASKNQQLSMLREAGVRPTVGQTLGGRWNAAEEKLMSVPIMGDAITSARERARTEFNRAAINRALAPIGQQTDDVGQAGVARAGDLIGDAYEAAKSQMGNFRLDRQAVGDLRNLSQMAQQLPDREAKAFTNIWQTISSDISPNGTITASNFKRIDSKLAQEAAKFAGSPDAYQKQLGDAIGELRKTLAGNALRSSPKAAQAMKAADSAYANLVRVEGASKAAASTSGNFTPGQLLSAVRQSDRSVRDRATARGSALMQDLASAGQNVLGNKVPNSGTADRLWLGAGGLGAGLLNPAIPAGLLGGAALYTRPVQGLLNAAIATRPQQAEAIRNALMQASPGFVPAGAQVGLGLLEY